MNKVEKVAYYLILGFIPPIFLFTSFWFLSYAFLSEKLIIPLAITGLICGILINFIFLRRWVNSFYDSLIWIIIAIFLFYHIAMLGFFMGMPLFNTLLGIIAGFYYGHKISRSKIVPKIQSKLITRISLISSGFMLLICVLSAIIALSSPSTPNDIKGMLYLNFIPSAKLLLLGIIFGGLCLVIFEFFLTRLTMVLILKKIEKLNQI
jgi:hypothetical protein